MAVLIWVVEGSWPACVDAAGRLGWSGDRVMLIYVREAEVTAAVAGAYAGLFGRGRPARDPSRRLCPVPGAAGVAADRAFRRVDPAAT